MLGITDPGILAVYILCILSTLLCVVYGLIMWNRGAEKEAAEIIQTLSWEKKEDNQEEEMGLK